MRILNFGSLNIDYVYTVAHFVQPGETVSSLKMERFPGGKGLNQSVSLALAGVDTYHAGCIGPDSDFLVETMAERGVNTSLVKTVEVPTGHAIIQVEQKGQNSIILFPGANHAVDLAWSKSVIDRFSPGDWLLLQNEINNIPQIIDYAFEKGMKIALNPSPMVNEIAKWHLEKISCFLINEIEGALLSGESEPDKICGVMNSRYPEAITVLTLGKAGATVAYQGKARFYPSVEGQVVDTTAAGDTFTGYFLASVMRGEDLDTAMVYANAAASIAVSRHGASVSIPAFDEVDALVKTL